MRLGLADRNIGGLTAARIVVVLFLTFGSRHAAKAHTQGPIPYPLHWTPASPTEHVRWAEGARGDEEKRGNGKHPSGSHH